MHDQNQPIPTQVTDKDINSLFWSVMAILNQAGVAGAQFDPSNPATYNRLLVALQTLFAGRAEATVTATSLVLRIPCSGLPSGATHAVLQVFRKNGISGSGFITDSFTYPVAFPNALMFPGGFTRRNAATGGLCFVQFGAVDRFGGTAFLAERIETSIASLDVFYFGFGY